MSAINWFPGHMHKARKEIKKVLSDVDIVIEILDARIPFSSANPLIKSLRGERPCIKILNKADLADPDVTALWQTRFEQDQAVKVLALEANRDARVKTLLALCRKLAAERVAKEQPVRAMVMGIPNVGKSTLINALAGRGIAKVGNEPAVTKRQQKIQLDRGVTLLDTPGILWPKLEPETCAYRLAVTGAIKDTAMEYEPVAEFALGYLRQHYADPLVQRYGLALHTLHELNTGKLLQQIGAKRGCLRPGGLVDWHKAATIVLNELRSGKLGRVSLETPEMMDSELSELREQIAQKRAAEQAEQDAKQRGQRDA